MKRRRSPKNPPRDGEGRVCLGRTETAKRLGIPLKTLKDWESQGRIRVFVDSEGWHWFSPSDIEVVAERERPLSSRAFALFRQGKTTVDVIVELGVEHSVVRGWREAFESYEAADSQQITMRIPRDLKHWAKVFGCSEADLRSPVKLLCALELCLSAPDLRARLDEAVQQALTPTPELTVSRETGAAA